MTSAEGHEVGKPRESRGIRWIGPGHAAGLLLRRAATLAVAAILAIVATVGTNRAFGGDPVTLDPPLTVRATLADGKQINGAVTRWDDDGFEGSVGRFRWTDFKPNDSYRIRKRFVDLRRDDRKARALDLLAWCWSVDDAKVVDRATRDAKALSASDDELDEAKARGSEMKSVRELKEAKAKLERLRSASPEGDTFLPDLWPVVIEQDRGARVQTLRTETAAKLAAAGREATPIEGRHTIVYSDFGTEDASNRSVELDTFITASLQRLGYAKEAAPPFWGKLVVIVVDGQDRFRLLEASAFRQQVTKDSVAFTHYDGPKAFVVALRQADATMTSLALYRAAALAILHRHLSAIRLPPWANEGIADWLVAIYPKGKPHDEPLRKPGLAFIRNGGSLEQVMELTYEGWPGRDANGRSAGFLLAGFMAEREPQRFQRFVASVKKGKPWKDALKDDFGATPAALLDAARRYYRVND